jgi:hypothetical protein
MADLANDCIELLLDEEFEAHDVAVHETLANGESAFSIVRHAAARKFNREDPLEAASAEYILRLT